MATSANLVDQSTRLQDRTRDLHQALQTELQYRERDYDFVTVLLLFWEDGDVDLDFKGEAAKLAEFFRERFNYPVLSYAIPNENPYVNLHVRILEQTKYHNSDRSLTIIHYGGHGDPDEPDRQSIWAAKQTGEPKLCWTSIQPTLGHIRGDVLLILDCCHAAQTARGLERVLPPNVELLAACPMHRKTNPPGDHSFTSIMIKTISTVLDEGAPVFVADLAHRLVSKGSKHHESIVHLALKVNNRSIQLQRPAGIKTVDQRDNHEASLSLNLMLRSPFDDALFNQIVHWLGHCAPEEIRGINVTNLVARAVHIERVVKNDNRGSSGRSEDLGSLHFSNDMQRAWDDFTTQLKYTLGILQPILKMDRQLDISQDMGAGYIGEFLREFSSGVAELQRRIEQILLSTPELRNVDSIRLKLLEPGIKEAGIASGLQLRLSTLLGSSQSEFLDADSTPALPQGDDVLPNIVFEDHPQLEAVAIEYKSFDWNDADCDATLVKNRMNRLAHILKTPSTMEYRVPECLGCISDEKRFRYGLVFRNPSGNTVKPISLYTIMRHHEKGVSNPQPPTLGQKFRLVLEIGRALLKWHRIPWVHEGIASYNVVFFRDAQTRRVDYSMPYLFGLDYSREADGISYRRTSKDESTRDVYRHAERQGWPPRKRHQKKHDIYSFGLLLLEVALWERLPKKFAKFIAEQDLAKLGDELVRMIDGGLRIYKGLAYEQAVRVCLTGDFDVREDDEYQSKLDQAFEEKVLKRIAVGVGIDGEMET